jgi:hypothetical protein
MARPIGTLTQKIQCHESVSGQHAADDRAERHAEQRDRRPGRERAGAPVGRERGAEQRQRQRHDHRAADALDRPGGDQDLDVRGQRAGRRRGGEDQHPAGEDLEAPVAVAEPRP